MIKILSTAVFMLAAIFGLLAQDYAYPILPANTLTISIPTPMLQWKGNANFAHYTVEIFEGAYIPGNNFNSIQLNDYNIAFVKDGPVAYEASALAHHENRPGNFITVDDEGTSIISYNNNFGSSNSISVTNYLEDDYEGITHLYGDYFVMAEERMGLLFFLKFNYGSSNSLSSINLLNTRNFNNPHLTGQNNGYEGITYNPVYNKLYLIKEYNDMKLFEANMPTAPNFNQSVSLTEPFNLQQANWSSGDVAGLYHLSLNKKLSATNTGSHLLLLSQESNTMYEIDLNGNLISQKQFDVFGTLANYTNGFFQAEGIAYQNGIIWIASEGTISNTAKYYGFQNTSHQNPIATLSSLVHTQSNLTGTQFQIPTCILNTNKTYCWKVTAFRANGTSTESEVHSFNTQFQPEDCGSTCPLNINHAYNEALNNSEYYASETITSNLNSNNVILRYYAANRIRLNIGFHTGSTFSAYIEACPGLENWTSQSK